jgi:hypothetical protein
MEHKPSFWDNFFLFRWMHRSNRHGRRRNRQQYTTRTNKHTKAYRAKRKQRNKAALRQRKINRKRCA